MLHSALTNLQFYLLYAYREAYLWKKLKPKVGSEVLLFSQFGVYTVLKVLSSQKRGG
jgi:hypothetical protein